MTSFQRATRAPASFGHAKSVIYLACLLAAGSSSAATAVPIARASITPADLGIIIAQGDPLSEAIGAYYQSARGIPAANVVRIALPTGADNLTPAQLATFKAQVDAALPANVQATVLTWTRPFRVQGSCGMSITSAFALGYDVKYCNNVFTASIPYFDSDSTRPWQDFGIRPSMMLGAQTYNEAVALITRGINAEASYPAGDGYLIRTTDGARSNPRWSDFSTLPAKWNFPGGLTLNYIDNATGSGSNFISNKNPVLFYFTGLESVPNLTTNTFAPGAVGDHLTSFGGILSGTYQMESTEWLQAGATGSYGTIEEPYAVQDKFPKASVMIDQYYRGATLIEAYWKSVRTPGQGLFLGEPLARPFADPAISTVSGGQYQLRTRAQRSGYRYDIEVRDNANSAWRTLTSTTLDRPGNLDMTAPVPASANAEARLSRCPKGLGAISLIPASSNYEVLQGGRTQRAYFQFRVKNVAAASTVCNQSVDISTLAMPDGLTAKIDQTSFNLNAQGTSDTIVTVDLPASVAATADAYYPIRLQLKDPQTGLTRTVQPGSIYAVASTTTDPDQAPLVRFRRPTDGWQLGDYAGRTSTYSYPIELDARPDAEIVYVDYTFAPSSLDQPSAFSPSLVITRSINQSTGGPNFAMDLSPETLVPGYYTLEARAYNAADDLVTTTTVTLRVNVQFQTILGTSRGDTLTGSDGNDIIIGGEGADLMTGGAGQDIFVYNSLRDALDQITDFTPGTDRLDLTTLVQGLGYTTANAWSLGVVTLVDTSAGVQVRIDTDGASGAGLPRPLVTLKGLTAAQIDRVRDLQLK